MLCVMRPARRTVSVSFAVFPAAAAFDRRFFGLKSRVYLLIVVHRCTSFAFILSVLRPIHADITRNTQQKSPLESGLFQRRREMKKVV